MQQGVRLTPAAVGDIAAVAALFARARAIALPFVPVLHTASEDHAFFAGLQERGRMTLAYAGTGLRGFMVESDGWLEHLYLDPDYRREGIGSRLLTAAQTRQAQISLWCFAQNVSALAFYRQHGFVEQRRTAGDNEERLPDIMLQWQRS